MRNKSKDKKGIQPKLRFPEFRGAWNVPTLGEISDRITKKVGSQSLETISISAGIGFVSQAEKFSRDISGEQYKNYIVLNKGDFSYNKGNSKKFPQGCVYKLTNFERVAAPNAFISFKFKKEYVSDFYQGYFENNFHGMQLKKFITSGARSNGLLNISPDDFFSIKLPTPIDKKEQKKIADCLSSLDELIEAEGQKLDALKDHKKGLMQELFPAEGKTFPTRRFAEFKNEPEWEEKKLCEFGKLISGLTYSPDDIRDSGLLVLRSSNVQNGLVSLEDNVYVRVDIKGVNLSQPNDIIICVRNGSKSLIGKSALIPQGMPLCTHGAFMTIFRSKSWKFVFQLFQTKAYQRQVDGDLGATINSINGNQFLKYKFFVPKPKEQQRIADFLSSVDDLIAAQSQKLDALRDHKRGLMQQLFPAVSEVQE